MKITKEKIKSLDPCKEGWEWYLENQEDDLLTLLLKVNENHPDWARWLFTKLMTKNQCVEIAIYAAQKVLNIFENQYPNDNRPRKAIEAAQDYLNGKGSASASYAAAYAAAAASDAAYASASYAAAYAAAYAAYASAYAAYAAADAAYAAYADKKKLQKKIIKKVVKILERDINE